MKIKLFKIFSCFLIMCMCLLAFQFKHSVKAQSSNFEPFEIGMTFPVGYELTLNNSNGLYPSKMYYFQNYNEEFALYFVWGIRLNTENLFDINLYTSPYGYDMFLYHTFDNLDNVILGYDYSAEDIPYDSTFELVGIDGINDGLLGIYGDIDENGEPNSIYSGTYELLANLIYGTSENLSSSQIGMLEFISMLFTILCILLPFIILFIVIRKLVD